MMIKKIVIIGILSISVLFFLRLHTGGNEDTWVCDVQGNWIKHGKPLYPSPVIPCKGTIPLGKTKEACLSQGGVWRKQGPEPYETCNRKTIDRGNLCRDNNECEGWCQVDLTREELSLGMHGKLNTSKKTGQCSVWVVELGCFGMMEKGKAKVLCID